MRSRTWQGLITVAAMALVGFTGALSSAPIANDSVSSSSAAVPSASVPSASVPSASSSSARSDAFLSVQRIGPNGEEIVVNTTDTVSFRVEYRDEDPFAAPDWFPLSCNGLSCDVLDSDNAVLLAPNEPDTVEVEFTTGSSPGAASVMLTVGDGIDTGLINSASKSVTVVLPADVSVKAVPASVTQYSEANTATFDVKNTTGSSLQYAITCTWQGAQGCSPSPSSPTIGGGATTTVTATFDAGSVLTDRELSLTATALGSSDTARDTIAVDGFGAVTVTADRATAYAEPSATDTSTYSVRFAGQSAADFRMTAACTGGASSCVVLAPDDTVTVGDAAVTVRVRHAAGADGDTSTVTLTATKVADATVSMADAMELVATAGVLLDVEGANPGLELMRSECPNIRVGAGAIVCDDFQYSYRFTPVTRKNRTRRLSLVHNSSVGAPQGRVNLDFVLPPGGTLPDTIKARLRVAGNDITDFSAPLTWQSYPDSTWMGRTYALGEKHRISFPWEWHNVPGNPQLHDVEVIFQQVFNGAAAQTDTVSGYTTSVDKRWTIAVGWWLGSWEFLNPDTHPDTGEPVLVWHSGDFSTRVYERQIVGSDTLFVGWTRARQDTIRAVGSNYVRHVDGGGEVHFNAWGFHERTITPAGDTTFFGTQFIGCCTRPTSVSVSTPAGRDTIYALDYTTGGILDAVRVVNASGGWDTFDVVADSFAHSGDELFIESITDPEGATTTFGQLPDWQGNPGYPLGKVIGPGGDTTNIGYLWDGSVAGVDTVKVQANAAGASPAIDITMPYVAASRVGMYWWDPEMTTRPTGDVYSRIDGPLPGSADSTAFYVNGFGAVRGTRDASGAETWIERQDPDYPALATRVRHPNGWTLEATYRGDGLLASTLDRSTGGVTTYEWNTQWSAPTKITSPEGVVTNFTYDAKGNRKTQELVGRGTATFNYGVHGLMTSLDDPLDHRTTFSYDGAGNLTEEDPPGSGWTRMSRDGVGRVTKTVTPIDATDSTIVAVTYDVMGRETLRETTSSLEAHWMRVHTTYDSIGRRIETVPWTDHPQQDSSSTGNSEWTYDQLGRVITEKSGTTVADTLVYDEAGRLIERRTPRGHVIEMEYDVLGRLRERIVPAVSYATESGAIIDFPLGHSSGLTLAADTATFTYDVMGNMLSATNQHAAVSRVYTLDGLVAFDTLDVSGTVHGLGYTYNLDRQRSGIVHPSALSPGNDLTAYHYDQAGALTSTVDPLGNVITLNYNADGQVTSKLFAGDGVDSVSYNAEHLVSARSVTTNNGTDVHVGSSRVYDHRGLVTSASGSTMTYAGLGQLAYMRYTPLSGFTVEEWFNPNGLGQTGELETFSDEGLDVRHTLFDHAYGTGGRLTGTFEEWVREFPASEPTEWVPGRTSYDYDASGNQTGMVNRPGIVGDSIVGED